MDEFGWRTIADGADRQPGPRRCSFERLAVTALGLRSGNKSPLNTRAGGDLDATARGVLNSSEGERLAVAARCSQRRRARPKRWLWTCSSAYLQTVPQAAMLILRAVEWCIG
jgi:hypothetical protein